MNKEKIYKVKLDTSDFPSAQKMMEGIIAEIPKLSDGFEKEFSKLGAQIIGIIHIVEEIPRRQDDDNNTVTNRLLYVYNVDG